MIRMRSYLKLVIGGIIIIMVISLFLVFILLIEIFSEGIPNQDLPYLLLVIFNLTYLLSHEIVEETLKEIENNEESKN